MTKQADRLIWGGGEKNKGTIPKYACCFILYCAAVGSQFNQCIKCKFTWLSSSHWTMWHWATWHLNELTKGAGHCALGVQWKEKKKKKRRIVNRFNFKLIFAFFVQFCLFYSCIVYWPFNHNTSCSISCRCFALVSAFKMYFKLYVSAFCLNMCLCGVGVYVYAACSLAF